MAIDMTTVKAISYNNKNVIKIEDGQGHILWQVGTPPTPTDEPIFLSSSNIQRKLENNTFSNNAIWTGLTSFNGNQIWSDGTDICYSNGTNYSYKLDTTTNTWTSFTPGININGNRVWSDGTDVYYSNSSSQYILNKNTGTWSSVTWTYIGGSGPIQGHCVIKVKNKFYCLYQGKLLELDIQNRTATVISTNFMGSGSSGGMAYNLWTDGTNIYYDSSSTHYIVDFDNYTWSNNTWSGLSSFIGCRVIKYNGKIIAQNGQSFYELDVATKTWSPYTFTLDNIPAPQDNFDRLWNYHGRWSGGTSILSSVIK